GVPGPANVRRRAGVDQDGGGGHARRRAAFDAPRPAQPRRPGPSAPRRHRDAPCRAGIDVGDRPSSIRRRRGMTTTSIAALARRALKWSALTTAARFVLQFAAQVALARMLGPGNFGVYGIGIAVLTFVGFLSGASFSYSLMLLPKVDDDDIRFSFTWQMVVGIASAAAMFAAAPAL